MTIETTSRIALEAEAAELCSLYEGRDAEALLRLVISDIYKDKVALVSSFGTEAGVLLHMVSEIDRDMPVVFLDTGKHFSETLTYRDELTKRLDLRNVRSVQPRKQAVAADDPTGLLHNSNPDLCCHVRKTIPMMQALNGFKCWITGRMGGQALSRTDLKTFEFQDRWIKVNPLAGWSAEDVESYYAAYSIPQHPLQASGYLSIGCAVCTKPVAPGADPRSGRWADSDKTECGIHFVDGKVVRG